MEEKSTSSSSTHRCKICDDVALHSNYGAMTCSPCKMFFKRNAVTGRLKFRCDFGDNCQVNIQNRHICPACRLKKCFDNGMQIELIRCPIARRPGATQRYDPMRCSSTRITNILTNIDPPALSQTTTTTTIESNLLMNLISYYDITDALTSARNLTDRTQVEEFLRHVYQCTGNYLRSNKDFSSLSSDDRSAIIRNTAENVTCLGAVSIWHRGQLIECPKFIQIYMNLYGDTSIEMIRSVLNRLDRDVDLMKLSISLFAFSNHSSIFSSTQSMPWINTKNVHRIQNSYCELIWKYLRSKYNYEESIHRWTNLLQCFLNATKVISEYQLINRHVQHIETIVEETELNLVIADIEENDPNSL